jgi:tetratricopeptide (TPR) repeat protein
MKKIITTIIILVPAIFLPLTTEFYDFNKQTLLAVGIGVVIIGLLIKYYRDKTLSIPATPLNLPILVLLLATTITIFTISPNKWESLLYPNGYGTTLLLTIWFFIVLSVWDVRNKSQLQTVLLIPSLFLSVMTIAQYAGAGINLVSDQPWAQIKTWNPTGSPLILMMFLLPIVPMLILEIIEKVKNNPENLKAPEMIVKEIGTVLVLITIALLTVQLTIDAKPAVLPIATGWAITAESSKNFATAFLGVGQLNYLYAFTTGRPPAYNALPLWNIRFTASSNYYLQLMTEIGIVGFIAYLFLMVRILRNCVKYLHGVMNKNYAHNYMLTGLVLSVIVIFVEQLFVPSNFLQLFLLYTLLACIAQYMITRHLTENSRVLFYILSIVGVIATLSLFNTIYRSWAAEYYMQKSLYALEAKNTKDAYDYQQFAIKSNPNIDKLQSVFSQTNMLYAVSLSQKKDLTDSDKELISKLAAASVQSGKTAVALNPFSVQNWENLAGIYRAMIGSIKDADIWTVQSYQQALALDPANPNLYLAMGGVYYAAKNYDTAINLFARSATLKRDYANAYYNLAAAYKEKKDWSNASQAMQAALANVPANSPEKKKAEDELIEIKKNIPNTPNTTDAGTPANTNNAPQSNNQQLENAGQTETQLTTPVKLNPEQIAPDLNKGRKTQPAESPSGTGSGTPSR